VTLNITAFSKWGIWQVTDHRLTDPNTRKMIDDNSIKHVGLRCRDGFAILAYAGVGKVRDLEISDWIREILRGENRTLDGSLIYLREKSTEDLGPLLEGNTRHMFSIGAILAGKSWIVQIRNFYCNRSGTFGPPKREFVTVAQPVEVLPQVFVFGAPTLSIQEINRIKNAIERKPDRPENISNLLAKINEMASKHPINGHLVSPSCLTTYMPPKGEPTSSKFHVREKRSKVVVVPHLLFGIDTTEMMRNLMNQKNSGVLNNTQLEQSGRKSIEPIDRLRK